jgi:hypothetical protein
MPGLPSPGQVTEFETQNRIIDAKGSEIIQAIVIESFQDPSLLDRDKIVEIIKTLDSDGQSMFHDAPATDKVDYEKETKFFLKLPRNSALVKPLQNSSDSEFNNLAYPFFSSHIMMPVKAGEFVWCVKIGNLYYWMSRIHGSDSYEDANYTHENRFKDASKGINYSPSEGFIPNFSNYRDNAQNSVALNPTKNNGITESQPFDDLINNSKQNNIVFEPVPRITPRPGDLVLQGSNNSAILLTTARGYDKNSKPEKGKSNANFESLDSPVDSGTIDLVVGRGRKRKEQPEVHDEASTQPRLIKNTRGQTETNKNPLYYESEKNIGKPSVDRSSDSSNFNGNTSLDVPEGDPHLLDDSARVYISMKMDADKSLGLNEYVPQSVPKPGASNAGQNLPPSKDSSTVLLRADEIRIVARKDDEREINGSIRIIKEGKINDVEGQGSAVIMIQPDGTIVIDGPKILIGGEKLIGDNGAGNQVSIGLGAEEPLVLGNELKLRLEEFMDATTRALDALISHTHPGFPAPYPPDIPFVTKCTMIKNEISITKSKLKNTLSKIGKTR